MPGTSGALAQCHQTAVRHFGGFFQTTIDTMPITLAGLVECDRPRRERTVERRVGAVIAHDDHVSNHRMREEIRHRVRDALLVVIRRQCDGNRRIADRIVPERRAATFGRKQDKQIDQRKQEARRNRQTAIPNEPLAGPQQVFVQTEHQTRHDHRDAGQI